MREPISIVESTKYNVILVQTNNGEIVFDFLTHHLRKNELQPH